MNKKYILLPFIFILSFLHCYPHEKVKLYALYTPSHEVLVNNWFLPSIQDDFEIVLNFSPQTCPSGHFKQKGWRETTIKKIDLIIRAIKENHNKIFIFSDVDIQFFAPIKNEILQLMKNKDMVIQQNKPGVVCSGFFACRGNTRTLRLFQAIKQYMLSNYANKYNKSDQDGLNHLLISTKNRFRIRWRYLPYKYFGAGTITGQHWEKGKPLAVPEDIVMHHANFTGGIPNKIAQLELVRDIVCERRKDAK